MIQLSCIEDLSNLQNNPNISEGFAGYLADYLKEMLSRFKTRNLQGFGRIFVLEDLSDANNYVELGFTKPMNTSEARYFVNVALLEGDASESITQLIFLNGNYATIIFAKDRVLIDYENQIQKEVV